VLYAHPSLLGEVDGAGDAAAEVLIGGIEALDRRVVVGGYPIRDLYVDRAAASSLVKRLGARPAVDDVNLVLRVVARIDAVPRRDDDRHVAEPVAALDLMEAYDARVRALGREVWMSQASAAWPSRVRRRRSG
jgi:hypothetical protein